MRRVLALAVCLFALSVAPARASLILSPIGEFDDIITIDLTAIGPTDGADLRFRMSTPDGFGIFDDIPLTVGPVQRLVTAAVDETRLRALGFSILANHGPIIFTLGTGSGTDTMNVPIINDWLQSRLAYAGIFDALLTKTDGPLPDLSTYELHGTVGIRFIPAPEPASILLVTTGLLMAARRRRAALKKAAQ